MDTLWTESPADFLLITMLLGGAAAYLIGRAVARTWRRTVTLLAYLILLDCGVRFIHFALAHDVLIAPISFLTDLIVLMAAGGLGFRLTRARQMATQYPWLFRRSGWLNWVRVADKPDP